MKFNKKITVTALSTVLGLGLVGSISGAVAWYQYSTRATTSIIGTSTGKGGTLLISTTGAENTWKRDLITSELDSRATAYNGKFSPVTFGGIARNAALSDTPRLNPIAGVANPTNWNAASSAQDYLQYTIYLKANELQADGTYAAANKDVYLSEIIMQEHDADASTTVDSLRIHLDVQEKANSTAEVTHRYFLISKNDLGTGLETNGYLDLDGDGYADKETKYEWESPSNDPIVYGVADSKQTSYLAATTGDNAIVATSEEISANNTDKIIAKTYAATGAETKIVVTIWNEGWAQYNTFTDPNDKEVKAMWNNGHNQAQFDIGLRFEIGAF